MSLKLLVLAILSLSAFGCLGQAPQASPGNQSCWTAAGKLYCVPGVNYSLTAQINASGPVPQAGLDMQECQRVYLVDPNQNVYTVRRMGDTLYGVFVDKKQGPALRVAEYSPESVLANPCAYREAFSQGGLNSGFCYYNSSSAALSCWENVTFTEGPRSVNGTEASLDSLNISGTDSVVGISNGTQVFLATICNRNYSQIFQLGFAEDSAAIGMRINGKSFCGAPQDAIADIWNQG